MFQPFTPIRQAICTGLFCICAVALSGCGGSADAPKTDVENAADATTAVETESEADVEDQVVENAGDEAAVSSPSDGGIANGLTEAKTYEAGSAGVNRTSSPAEVCDAFVRSLHKREILAAERLLTLSSRITIHDEGLELDALAGENAQYVIGEAKYATQAKQLAYVDCHVSERSEEGEINFVVRWMLKPEAGYGWRVFGMVMNEEGQNRMINFENSDHAQVVSDIYVGNELDESPISRQADSGTDPIH